MAFNLSEVTLLSESYKAAGLGETFSGRFLDSIATQGKPPRGRGIAILDDIIKKGAPETWPLWQKANEYLEVAKTCTIPSEAQTLRDFAGRIFSGYDLTEKQKSYAEKLVNGATRKVDTIEITEEIKSLLDALRFLMLSMSTTYWEYRPGTCSRLKTIFRNVSDEEINLLATKISKEDLDYVKGVFKSYVKIWDEFPQYYGHLCKVNTAYIKELHYEKNIMIDALIIGNRQGNKYGKIVADCLVDGVIMKLPVDLLIFSRKKPKSKKQI